MPQRFLRPGLTTSKRFNSVPWISQSFYIRLITLVDDYGRYEADPRLLRSHCFPFGDNKGKDLPLTTIDSICEQLLSAKLVYFYDGENGKKYLQLTKWQERARSASKYPAPDCEQLLAFDNNCLLPSPSPSSPPSPTPAGGAPANASDRPLSSAERISSEKELERIETELRDIRKKYNPGETWDDKDRNRANKVLKPRKSELLTKLGAVA